MTCHTIRGSFTPGWRAALPGPSRFVLTDNPEHVLNNNRFQPSHGPRRFCQSSALLPLGGRRAGPGGYFSPGRRPPCPWNETSVIPRRHFCSSSRRAYKGRGPCGPRTRRGLRSPGAALCFPPSFTPSGPRQIHLKGKGCALECRGRNSPCTSWE